MPVYNHMFTLAFSVKTTHTGKEGDLVPAEELKAALLERIQNLDDCSEWHEAVGDPQDTYITPEYLLVPGLVRSQTDGDSHYVSAARLATLYGVRMDECFVLPHPSPVNIIARRLLLEQVFTGELIALAPRYDGVYKLPEA